MAKQINWNLQKRASHPVFARFVGEKVDITIRGKTFKGVIPYFIGNNKVNNKTIVLHDEARSVFWIQNWNEIVIKTSIHDRGKNYGEY
jgi:hypothetical protein